ncbi:MAG: CCA tRNA nucleotidyltransferase [Pseudomonadota bacterium]
MKPLENVLIQEDWLQEASLQKLFDILTADGGETMVAGGAVRNALMGEPVADVDLCTTLLPQEVTARLERAGEKAVPTGIDHGTITAIIDQVPYEVTTLREDIETDGRHAVVKFGTDWIADAGRRDLTINALYCDREGQIYDFVDGYKDVGEKHVRFIGDAGERIKEDSLRILRFFRFFAWYGGGRPDAEGLKACNAHKKLLGGLSVERVWMELKKLLAAPDPGRALLWMRTTGILGGLLPETVKWGIDAIPGLVRLEQEERWQADAMLRLMAMIRPDLENVQGLAKRLALSNTERERLVDWAKSAPPKPQTEKSELEKLLYRGSQQGMLDAMKLEVVHLRNRDDEGGADAMLVLVNHATEWRKPEFPVKGQDLLDTGFEAGPKMGKKLAELEEKWLESGFELGKGELLE